MNTLNWVEATDKGFICKANIDDKVVVKILKEIGNHDGGFDIEYHAYVCFGNRMRGIKIDSHNDLFSLQRKCQNWVGEFFEMFEFKK